MRAVGAPVLGEAYDEKLFRAAAGFGGGVGGTHEHICGAITGGVIVMSMLYARTDPAIKDDVLYAHIKKYIERFNAEIVRLAEERDIILFSDEMYRLLEHDPRDRLPSAADLDEKAIALSGMSKTFGLAGLRLGWLACRDQVLLSQIAGYKDYTTIDHEDP